MTQNHPHDHAKSLFLFNRESNAEHRTAALSVVFNPQWQELERWEPRLPLLGGVLKALGIIDLVPAGIASKINKPERTVVLYRIR
jgi:hypothetical protein